MHNDIHCSVACLPDGLPAVGAVSRYPGLFVATGHAMMGLTLGPATGKLIAECGGKIFEMLRRIKDEDSDVACPDCRSKKVERMLSTFAAGSCGSSGSRGFT